MTYFKDIHTYKSGILRKDSILYGKCFPAGSVLLVNSYTSSFSSGMDVYVATKIPGSYKGQNPILTLYVYSDVNGMWTKDIFHGIITRKIWNTYLKFGKPEINKLYIPDEKALEMMKHERRHKSGAGAREYKNAINGSLAYKQVTELAYWANLNNSKSGNASVVAANIR